MGRLGVGGLGVGWRVGRLCAGGEWVNWVWGGLGVAKTIHIQWNCSISLPCDIIYRALDI